MVDLKNKLSENGLKITPQRLIILEAIYSIDHPTADDIIKYIRKKHSNIATGTVYKVLEKFVEKGLIKKITTDKDVIRFDGIMTPHHHLYSIDSDVIKDYEDEKLDNILKEYFSNRELPGFDIEEITIQIKGRFNN